MGEYRHTVAKTQQQGFAESPQQEISNSGNSFFDRSLTIGNAVVLSAGFRIGKQVFNSAFTSTIDQIGNSRLEEAIEGFKKGLGYATILAFPGGAPIAAGAFIAESLALAVTTAVDNHAINLDNDKLRKTRGSLINFSGAEYYG